MLKLDEVSDKPGMVSTGAVATILKKKLSSQLGGVVTAVPSKLASVARDDGSSIEDEEAENLDKGIASEGEVDMMDFDQYDNSDELM